MVPGRCSSSSSKSKAARPASLEAAAGRLQRDECLGCYFSFVPKSLLSSNHKGNRLSKTDQASGITSNYGYDSIYQLTGVTQGTSTSESYSYDPVGNRLSSLNVSPYAYNPSNQLTSTPAASYTYDANGSLKTKLDSTGTTTYNWDIENRLSSVVLPGTGGTVSFKYDPFGRRVQKSGPLGTTNYLYDGRNLLEE